MSREEAKELFRNDKDAYGKPKHIMENIDKIYDDFESAKQLNKNITDDDIILYWAKQLEHKSLSVHELVENAKWLIRSVNRKF